MLPFEESYRKCSYARVEVEAERVVATVLCGRPIVAVTLHIVHIGAVAEARSRKIRVVTELFRKERDA